MTQAIGRYAIVMLGTIALAAWLLTMVVSGGGATPAIAISAAVAAAVQIGAFAVTRSMIAQNMIAAWGAGALVRMLTLFAYAVIAIKVLQLPAMPALLSLFVFFFVSTLLEPFFLRR
jgi:hypothetical protein